MINERGTRRKRPRRRVEEENIREQKGTMMMGSLEGRGGEGGKGVGGGEGGKGEGEKEGERGKVGRWMENLLCN